MSLPVYSQVLPIILGRSAVRRSPFGVHAYLGCWLPSFPVVGRLYFANGSVG